MRLRHLATTQSITFFAPPAVYQSVKDLCRLRPQEAVTSAHIVRWLLEQTCRLNEQLQTLYIAQGLDFCSRMDAEWKYQSTIFTNKSHQTALLNVLQHPEPHNLEELYGGRSSHPKNLQDSTPEIKFSIFQNFMDSLRSKRQITVSSMNKYANSVGMEEVEQEREVEFEVEEERQVQRPVHYKALKFPRLDKNITEFTTSGTWVYPPGFYQVFEALKHTTVGQKHHICGTNSKLFLSPEFMRTIELSENSGEPSKSDFLVSILYLMYHSMLPFH